VEVVVAVNIVVAVIVAFLLGEAVFGVVNVVVVFCIGSYSSC
jgi:hypothetical protein